MMLVVAAWVIGRIVSDRYGWSQWLLWIPTPAALIASAAGILLAFRATLKPRDGRVRALLWCIATFFIAVYFVALEHHLLRGSPHIPVDAKTMRITHWNMGPATWHDIAPSVAALIRLDGDIIVVTDPAGTTVREDVMQWMGTDTPPPVVGQLSLLTRLPISTVRPLIATPDMQVVLVQIDATAKIGRLLTVYMVDMPSELKFGRMALARRVHTMLEELKPPMPDVVVGDFNMTRGSIALREMFKDFGLSHACDEAGHGYAATFHREFPLWHIDHILLGPNVEALDYSISNPGIGRHRAQSAVIAAMESGKQNDTRTGLHELFR
jgi:hypothetical protein